MRGITITLSIVALLSACLSAWLYSMIGSEKDRLRKSVDSLHTQIATSRAASATLAGEKADLEARLAALEKASNELKARNVTLEARNSQLSRDVVDLRSELDARSHSDTAAAQENAELRRQLVETKSALATATATFSAEDLAAYKARIAELEAEVSYLRKDSSGEALSEALARVPPDLEGAVLEVGPDEDFVILNIGTRNGAVPSLELVLRRGRKIIARVRLTDVRDSFSVAHVLPSSSNAKIRAGDSATRS